MIVDYVWVSDGRCTTEWSRGNAWFLTENNSTGGKMQVLCGHCRKAETRQFYSDLTVMIDDALLPGITDQR